MGNKQCLSPRLRQTLTPAVRLSTRLQLLGNPQLHPPGAAPRPLARKDALLLAYLALVGAQPREHLAAWLWPEASTAGARANLRQRLKRLQDEAGGALFAAGTTHVALHRELVNDLPSALDTDATWQPLLGNLQFDDDAPEAARWLAQARDRLAQQRRLAATEQVLQSLREGQPGAALEPASRLVAEDPANESHVRLLMRVHQALGDRAAALAAFDALCEHLGGEATDAPEPATQALADELRQNTTRPAPTAAGGARSPLATAGGRVAGRRRGRGGRRRRHRQIAPAGRLL